jgi:hypothetical protein
VESFRRFAAVSGFQLERLVGGGRQATDLLLAFLVQQRSARSGGGRAPLQARTLEARAAAVGFWFACRGEARPGGPQLTLLLNSYKLEDGGGGGRAKVPFSIAALRWAASRARAAGSARGRALAAVLLVEFFFCCRVGEICANDKGARGVHIIRRQDVTLLTGQATALPLELAVARPASVEGAALLFRGSKADKFRIGAERAHWKPSGEAELCPVGAVQYLMAQGAGVGFGGVAEEGLPLASYWPEGGGRPVTFRRSDVVAAVKEAAVAMGWRAADFSSHSLRRGAATALRRAKNSSDAEVAYLGRWQLPGAFRGYGLASLGQTKGQVPRMIAGGS